MSQNGNAVIRDKVPCSVSLITGYPLTCAELAFTGVYSGVMMDFLQVCPFTGIGFSTMFDFHKCVLSLGTECPLQCLTFTSVCILSMVLMCPLLCLPVVCKME